MDRKLSIPFIYTPFDPQSLTLSTVALRKSGERGLCLFPLTRKLRVTPGTPGPLKINKLTNARL
jgi:hypothetical protein